tara:strand:+ start:110 stop:679 length:570 start_codon:yes stop_codon:yes gene_type:complete
MLDYNNGKIYKIINSENEVIYIGSTVDKLCKRYSTHEHKAIGNKIILIENCPCNSREELVKKEQEIIEQYDNLLNKFRAYRSEEDNTEDRKKTRKKYRDKNKEKLSEKAKVDYEENKDKYHKKYKKHYEKNKDKISEKVKKYKEKNKEKISEYNKVKVNCECGCEIRKYCLSKHKKTKKHIKLMENIII